MGSTIKAIKNHYTICGYGHIGRIVSQELKLKGISLLVIDNNSDIKEVLETDGIPYIIDDAINEDILMEAGIEGAKGLVSLVIFDADNLFITMTARVLNTDLFRHRPQCNGSRGSKQAYQSVVFEVCRRCGR
jgi:voltage-gated potassium channel